MTKARPTNEELAAALGLLLAEYCVIDEMLDDFMAAPMAGATPKEKLRQRQSNRARNAVQRTYERATCAKAA